MGETGDPGRNPRTPLYDRYREFGQIRKSMTCLLTSGAQIECFIANVEACFRMWTWARFSQEWTSIVPINKQRHAVQQRDNFGLRLWFMAEMQYLLKFWENKNAQRTGYSTQDIYISILMEPEKPLNNVVMS